MMNYNGKLKSTNTWIGDIPFDWKVSKLKHYSNIVTGNTPSTNSEDNFTQMDGIPWVKPGDLNNFTPIKESNQYLSQKGVDYARIVRKGSVLIGGIGDIGKLGVAGVELTTNQQIHSVEGKTEKINDEYLKYLLFVSIDELQKNSSSVVLSILTKTKLQDLTIVVPPLKEQFSIANFLDHQTSLIDTIIFKKEKLIELLKEKRQAVINEAVTIGLDPTSKMKDSGVEWLGEIPEGWEVVKLKKIANAYGRIGYRGYTTEDIVENGKGAITISPSNMKGDFMTFENCTYLNWNKYEESPEIKIFNKDILMVKTGSTYGKIGLVKDLSEKATINPQLLVLKDIKINSEYLFNLMRTPFIQYQVETNVVGSTIPTISQTKILNFQLPIPPLDQVDKIVEYMNQSMNNIDLTVQMVFSQIEKLKEYRQSLISEAVTGKIDVRDWETKQKN